MNRRSAGVVSPPGAVDDVGRTPADTERARSGRRPSPHHQNVTTAPDLGSGVEISAVVPVYRSAAILPRLHDRLSVALAAITTRYEIGRASCRERVSSVV